MLTVVFLSSSLADRSFATETDLPKMPSLYSFTEEEEMLRDAGEFVMFPLYSPKKKSVKLSRGKPTNSLFDAFPQSRSSPRM